jgi:bifunctional enzyme CysN/CysC
MADEPILPGRAYLMKARHPTVTATVRRPEISIDVNTLAHEAAQRRWTLNEIGVCNDLARPGNPVRPL